VLDELVDRQEPGQRRSGDGTSLMVTESRSPSTMMTAPTTSGTFARKCTVTLWIMYFRLWVMYYGLWVMAYGLWIMDYGMEVHRHLV